MPDNSINFNPQGSQTGRTIYRTQSMETDRTINHTWSRESNLPLTPGLGSEFSTIWSEHTRNTCQQILQDLEKHVLSAYLVNKLKENPVKINSRYDLLRKGLE
jgi:hypothetical protein